MSEENKTVKKRGRPAKKEAMQKEEAMQGVEKVLESKGRPEPGNRSGRRRSSAGSQTSGPLAMTGQRDEENYVYRIVNDEGNRIDLHKSYGYELVQNEGVDFISGNAVKTGSVTSVVVDKQTGKKGVLMRQPKEFHEEDAKAKADLIKKREESMFRKLKTDEGRYGDVENTNSLAKAIKD
jgi:hypothetical protein